MEKYDLNKNSLCADFEDSDRQGHRQYRLPFKKQNPFRFWESPYELR